MRKVIVVAVREYQAAVKTKAFIISLVALPLLWGGLFAVQMLLKDKVDTKDKRFAVLDYTGQIAGPIVESAQKRNAKNIYEGEDPARAQVAPRYLVTVIEPTNSDLSTTTFELSERVRKNDFMAFVVIGPDVFQPDAPESARAAITYHSNMPTYDDIQKWLREPINDRIRDLRLKAANLDPAIVAEVTKRVAVQNLGLVEKDAQGNITKAEKTNELANIFVPMGLMMLMVMVITVGATPLMQSVLEEKTLRIAEVLLGSVPPFQLMMGKLIGMVGVSLTIATVYLSASFVAVHQAGLDHLFPRHVIWWFVVFQAFAVLMFGALFISVGAAVTDIKEAQSLMMPLMLMIMSPLFIWLNVVKEPTSTMALAASLFPPATPMLMTLRLVVPPGVPLWQPMLGLALMVFTTIVFVFAAGRIFRVGILMQGKGAKVSEMFRWVFRG